MDTEHVLSIDVPTMFHGKTPQQVVDFYKEIIRRIDALPGVSTTSFGTLIPWRNRARRSRCSSRRMVTPICPAWMTRARDGALSPRGSSPRWAFPSLRAVISMPAIATTQNRW